MSSDAAGSLTAFVNEVIEESKKLRQDINDYEMAHRRERRAYRVMGIFLIGAIIVTLALLGTSRAALNSTRATLDYVRSCTTPDGACYKASRAGTVDFRQQLLGVTAVIADCATGSHGDQKAYRACVTKRTSLDASVTVAVDPQK